MSLIMSRTRKSSHVDKPQNPGQRRSADFARAAVFAEFGYRHAQALDYENFVDRLPGELPARASEAKLR
jgi:hypothetical protein